MSTMDEPTLAEQLEAMKDDDDAWGEPVSAPTHPRSERRQRGSVVSVRLTVEELARIQAYADHQNLSLSGALRTAALEAAGAIVNVRTHRRWTGSTASNANGGDSQNIKDVQSNIRTGISCA